ncbi:MAG: glycosyltransferase family 2 protein [Pirellulaceae bacterium]|jgi:dolichol-phosphate mannosyltransferase|nr:glycosyltransferase family 2 protein [Pirellulaceae bacterium]
MVELPPRSLTALPVYNEARHVDDVLDHVRRFAQDVLVVDDGSTDGTAQRLAARRDVRVLTHPTNRGYGAALRSAFRYAIDGGYGVLVTIDCDGQHEPQRIPWFAAACRDADIVSGSRYLRKYAHDSAPPVQRQRINQRLTAELNQRLGLQLTDAFCGFKAYRVAALARLQLTETGYAMPLELWVQAAALGMRILELPVPLIYLDEERSFGGMLDDADTRLRYYYEVLERSIRAAGLRAPAAVHPVGDGRTA